jgi:predicted restriction endonuclease|tara:strand:- start:340 stop:663 length:324 start_codon:yes stop_codon:yes gene_type:complete
MTEQEIRKYGEIQYIKGRLDELNKALPTITNLERKRKLDQRIEKYFFKLKKVDEVSYHLYNVELLNRYNSKEKSKLEIKDLLEQILINETILNEDIKERIQQQINNY